MERKSKFSRGDLGVAVSTYFSASQGLRTYSPPAEAVCILTNSYGEKVQFRSRDGRWYFVDLRGNLLYLASEHKLEDFIYDDKGCVKE